MAAKKKRLVASERTEQQRRACRRAVAGGNGGDFVFGDARGINIDWARDYGRAAPGERGVATNPSTRGENLSVLGALGYDEWRAAMRVPGAVDGDACLVFTTEVLAPSLHPGNIVFLDHVPPHKMPAIAAALTAVGTRVKFLPPYSPDLSPMENCWSQVKTLLRSGAARTRKALDAALSQALATITRDDIEGWFAHCRYVDALN